MLTFNEFINEGLHLDEDLEELGLHLDEDLTIDAHEIEGDIFTISINGKFYKYKSAIDKDIESIAKSFKGMLKYSAGKALAFLKKNTALAE